MTVFKAFLKILNKNKFIIIIYTIFLIGFGGFNMQTSENNPNFVASKPDIMIVNNDEEKGLIRVFESAFLFFAGFARNRETRH